MKRNSTFNRLKENYLFVEIRKRVQAFSKKNPNTKLLHLSIGDTSLPLPSLISEAISRRSLDLSTHEGYSGYGPEQGNERLRSRIAEKIYKGKITSDEIFISDGAKCDLGRLGGLFGNNLRVALPDPSYPVYLDASLLMNQKEVIPLACLPENNFFPDLSHLDCDLIFFCSPSNPTGKAATHEELKALISAAKRKGAFIIYDSAYSAYIQNPTLPKSIYEVEGAKEVAIEVNSFSKSFGFSGVRLGWTVIPKNLLYEDGLSVNSDWNRITTTLFNGASLLSQEGGLAALSDEGLIESQNQIKFYLSQAKSLKEALIRKGYEVYGGVHAPYLWVSTGKNDGWSFFDEFLMEKGIIITPGVGFGGRGDHFVRFSALAPQKVIEEAIQRI